MHWHDFFFKSEWAEAGTFWYNCTYFFQVNALEKRGDVFILKEEPSRNTALTQTESVTCDLSEHYLLIREFQTS